MDQNERFFWSPHLYSIWLGHVDETFGVHPEGTYLETSKNGQISIFFFLRPKNMCLLGVIQYHNFSRADPHWVEGQILWRNCPQRIYLIFPLIITKEIFSACPGKPFLSSIFLRFLLGRDPHIETQIETCYPKFLQWKMRHIRLYIKLQSSTTILNFQQFVKSTNL